MATRGWRAVLTTAATSARALLAGTTRLTRASTHLASTAHAPCHAPDIADHGRRTYISACARQFTAGPGLPPIAAKFLEHGLDLTSSTRDSEQTIIGLAGQLAHQARRERQSLLRRTALLDSIADTAGQRISGFD